MLPSRTWEIDRENAVECEACRTLALFLAAAKLDVRTFGRRSSDHLQRISPPKVPAICLISRARD